MEHPFFVYGQGWASCNPEGSLRLFGLKCQRLQVGDICISLKPREHKINQPKHQQQLQQQQQHMNEFSSRSTSFPHHHPHHQINNNNNNSMHHHKNGFPISPSQIPQNLSKRPQTITTNATDTTIVSRLAPHLVPYSSIQSLASSTTTATTTPILSAAEIRNSHIESIVNGIAAGRGLSPPTSQQQQRRRPLSHESTTSTFKGHPDDSQPLSMVLNDKDHSPREESAASRKRRWSAPDIIDDGEDQAQQRLQPPNSQLARTIGN
jgi:ataxin 1/1L